ncbi:MAG: hypothetical protein AB9873_09755 [Syntrophobacteraceae bacterium]
MVTKKRLFCPLLQEDRPECFSHDLRSQNVEAALHYCTGIFEDCANYKMAEASSKQPPGRLKGGAHDKRLTRDPAPSHEESARDAKKEEALCKCNLHHHLIFTAV